MQWNRGKGAHMTTGRGKMIVHTRRAVTDLPRDSQIIRIQQKAGSRCRAQTRKALCSRRIATTVRTEIMAYLDVSAFLDFPHDNCAVRIDPVQTPSQKGHQTTDAQWHTRQEEESNQNMHEETGQRTRLSLLLSQRESESHAHAHAHAKSIRTHFVFSSSVNPLASTAAIFSTRPPSKPAVSPPPLG